MTRRSRNDARRRIQDLAREWALQFPEHAMEEMRDDLLSKDDVQRVLLAGWLVARQTHGDRGTRYVLRGMAHDDRVIEVVCRILRERVRVVTVYRVE